MKPQGTMMTPKKPIGRPSLFTEKLGEQICSRLADGESLRSICDDEGMPHRRTIRAWNYADPDFAGRYARARAEGMYVLAEGAMERASSCTSENAAAVRVYVDTVKWFASKMAPAAFGDRITADIDAKVTVTAEQPLLELARSAAFLLEIGRRSLEAQRQEIASDQVELSGAPPVNPR